MLPYFNILVGDNNNSEKKRNMYSVEVPVKPSRRKKIHEVPIVHKVQIEKSPEELPQRHKKTYSANFNSKRTKQKDLDVFEDVDERKDVEEVTNKIRLSKKFLLKENEKLLTENNDLKLKITLTEDYLNKKNCKLKEKCTEIVIANDEFAKENDELKRQIQIYQSDIETYRNCKQCVEFTKTLDDYKKELNVTQNINKEYELDIDMLKNVIYR